VTDYIGTPEVMADLYEAGGRPPAMVEVLDEASSDPVIKGFGAAGLSGQPQPKFPCMSKVYDTWTAAYAQIFQGGDPAKAFTDANDAIATACEGS
jgi:arabinogalactan oligomer / maltooligosaccharide transport system substrate-binding protein